MIILRIKRQSFLSLQKRGLRILVKKIEEAKAKKQEPEEQLKLIAYAYWDFAFRIQRTLPVDVWFGNARV
jgi:hypothetical protein